MGVISHITNCLSFVEQEAQKARSEHSFRSSRISERVRTGVENECMPFVFCCGL